jgi:hypothetical protein
MASSPPVEGLAKAGVVGQPDQERQQQRDEQGDLEPIEVKPQPPHLHGHQEREGEDQRSAERASEILPEEGVTLASHPCAPPSPALLHARYTVLFQCFERACLLEGELIRANCTG